MVPEGILLLLFVILTSSFADLLEVKINMLEKTTEEGSSITIPCGYLKQKEQSNLKLLWFKDPYFDTKSEMFNGTIVYSNTKERPQSPDYSNRVEYMTNLTSTMQIKEWIQCDLRITNLQKTDSGNYSFRFIGSEKNKYMGKAMTLTVKDNPCKVHVKPPELENPLKESEEFTVYCSTFSSCLKYPEWLIHAGQKQEWTSSSLTDMIIETEEEEEGRNVTKLKLNVTWMDDKRILSCRPAQSQDIFQIRNITLSVEYAPKETTAIVSSSVVKEGDYVTLSCTSRGNPNVAFSWLKDEKSLSQDVSNLTLNHVKPKDSGNYSCTATNKHGSMKSNIIIIDVKYGPNNVTVEPLVKVEDLKEGDTLILKCSVQESNPPATQFKWYFKNNVLQQTNNTLTIYNIAAGNRGSYHCQAGNALKSVTSNTIQISVKYSPQNIEIQGKDFVQVNSRLNLTCSAEANPKPVYTWNHINGLSNIPLSSQTGQLNIDNVTNQHAGQYTCDVKNTIGTRSRSINVDVLYPPSKLSLNMKSEVREFEELSIVCTVQSFPKSNITVTRSQYVLRNIQSNRGNITESANYLTIYLNVTESDAGRYKCKAENSEGNLETEQHLTVLYAPKNVTASSKGEQKFGSQLTLTCNARAKPAPSSYEWMKRFNGQFKTVGHEQKLHFDSLNISDSGQFICIAINSIGKTRSQSVEIRVKYTPNINIIHNMTDERNWEFTVYLTCSADAYPPATDYKWYRKEDNTTVLSDQQNFTVLPQNPGTYYCTATNSIGESQSKNIVLFLSSNSLKVFYQIIVPVFLLLMLIAAAMFLIHRTIIKARLDQQSGADNPLCFFPGSQNNTRGNMSMEDIPDPCQGIRVNPSHPTPHSQDPTQTQDLNPNPRPKSNIHTVYSAIKLPQMKLGKCSPKPQKPEYVDNDSAALNYVTLDFKRQNEPKRAPEGSAVYAMVKNKQLKNSRSEHDYENVSSICAPKRPFINADWESDTSEEDEVNYSTVSCSAKPIVKEPKHNHNFSSSSSDNEDITEYSAIKHKQ